MPEDPTYLLRFAHLESVVAGDPHLVGDAEAIAALRGLSPHDYDALRTQLATGVAAAARELMCEPEWRERLAALPWQGKTVVAVGDSITADLQSWARILEAALALDESQAGTRIVNHGLDGDTSAGVLARLPAILAERPEHVLIMIGTNDGQGLADGATPWISDAETRRNLAAIGATLARHGAAVTWIAPPRMDVAAIANDSFLGGLPIGWSSARHEGKRRIVLQQPGTTWDAAEALGEDRGLLLDGLHPSLDGHRRIAEQLVRALGATGGAAAG